MRYPITPLLAIAAIVSAAPALAVPVTWHMTGEVTTGNQGDFFFPFQTRAGDPIAFDFSFDTQRACGLCDPNVRSYENPLTAFSMTVGDSLFRVPLDSSSISLRNDSLSPAGGFFIDGLTIDAGGTNSSGISFFGDLVVQNTSTTAPVPGINDAELAHLTPPDASLFSDPSLSFFNFGASAGGGFDSFGGRFLTSSVVSTPEPGAFALLVPGLFGVWFIRRRLSRRDTATA